MKNRNIIIIIAAALLVVLLFVLMLSGGSGSTTSRTKKFDWDESYRKAKVQPYEVSWFYKLLNSYSPGKKVTSMDKRAREALPVSAGARGDIYAFVGPALFLTTEDADTLVRFVEKGGQAFICSKSIPYELMDFLYFDDCYGQRWQDFSAFDDTTASLDFRHSNLALDSTLSISFYNGKKKKQTSWAYIDENYLCREVDDSYNYTHRTGFIPLGTITENLSTNAHCNFARLDYGEGSFYFHTTPMAFTNYQIRNERDLKYVERVISHLKPGNIFWDTRAMSRDASKPRHERDRERKEAFQSPLKTILKEPEMRWGWYLLIGLTLTYMLFQSKRRQRIIPVLEENANSSLAFVRTIGMLYFQQGNHKSLCDQKMRLFLGHIREKYKISTQEEPAELITKISRRTGVKEDIIKRIFDEYHETATDISVDANRLIRLHQAMAAFYKLTR